MPEPFEGARCLSCIANCATVCTLCSRSHAAYYVDCYKKHLNEMECFAAALGMALPPVDAERLAKTHWGRAMKYLEDTK